MYVMVRIVTALAAQRSQPASCRSTWHLLSLWHWTAWDRHRCRPCLRQSSALWGTFKPYKHSLPLVEHASAVKPPSITKQVESLNCCKRGFQILAFASFNREAHHAS